MPAAHSLLPALLRPALSGSELLDWFIGAPAGIVLTIAVAIVVRFLLCKAIGASVKAAENRHNSNLAGLPGRAGRAIAGAAGIDRERYIQRTLTMASVLNSVVTATVGGIATLTILDLLGIPLAPLLASAGVGGVALGFGAQSLVKDFLSGVFMILEDQYGVGDVIDVGTVTGTVEDVSLRVTRLRDAAGVAWYVRNGEIVRVGNKSQGWSTANVEIPVSYEESIDKALGIVRGVVDEFDPEGEFKGKVLEPPAVVGVDAMNGTTVTILVSAKCVANENWGVQRDLRQRIKSALDEAGVRAPTVQAGGATQGATS